MGTHSRQQEATVTETLLTESSKFSYIQAVRLLEHRFRHDETATHPKIRTRPRLSLDFPNSDIVEITEDDELITLVVTFLGLYGESSPLPTFYTESLLDEERDEKSVMREFIDIFNIPVYQAYFKIWLKNQLGVRLNEFHDTRVLELFHVFSGMPYAETREKFQGDYNLLKYAGLNMHFPRSAEALRTLMRDLIGSDTLEIEQCVEQMAEIPSRQHCALGVRNSTLDDDLHLGSKIKDRMSKFRVVIDDLDMNEFNLLLPQAKKFNSLVKTAKLYIGEGLSWDLQLTLKADETQEIALGVDGHSRLGLNSWLGNGPKARTLLLNNLDKGLTYGSQ